MIRGTRVTVELILRRLSEGATGKDLLEAYPMCAASVMKANVCEDETQAFDDEKVVWFLLLWTGMYRRTR